MEIVIHNHFTLESASDVHQLYQTPIWEIEIQSDALDNPTFEDALRCDDNFIVSQSHYGSNLRSVFTGTKYLNTFLKETVLNAVCDNQVFKSKYPRPIEYYQSATSMFGVILRDQPGFSMIPHLDNGHIAVQLIVNLLQDNETATEFYHFNESVPCYKAPLKKNHGVMFVNTPGSVHSISNISKQRWIWYGGLLI